MTFRPRSPHSRSHRKRSRTIAIPGDPVSGDGRDFGRYYRCWNCGFICDSERDRSVSTENTITKDYQIHENTYSTDMLTTNRPPDSGVQYGAEIHGENHGVALLGMSSIRLGHVSLQVDANGEQVTRRENYYIAAVVAGCPLCGCTNYKG